ncbi:biotin carboxylase N-terminal domain-containing protein [Sulfitobacter dubius]|uniref:Acetyl-/propionyl-coenzyme A carboxylase alpha chain n=1 Tax=Sulfitobacter dubius TaxID=218673 RepID=A0ABY3ZRE6_9RHOB|nr:biotin carboxylase N-terminal domain-containing protein [Sulfitobacter dubius]UOA17196.1 Acetyl-/propionyl-coenzyme A carboxylase alpha chain [Sulfitobacter dubius]
MIQKLFIANRGEIACRIMRTCERMGIGVVTCHSDADATALHVNASPQSVRIGPAPSVKSYLDGAAIIRAALETGCDALHPGYGFLSESADFAAAVEAAGLIFVGPAPETIESMGDKARAKTIMIEAGVATVPGGSHASDDPAQVAEWLETFEFPALLKPVAGGGGKGMVVLDAPPKGDEITAAIRTAKASFGDGRLLVEQMISAPRHIEVQIFGDGCGNVVHLYDRECSLQRRHQKVIEEAPATNLPETLRQNMIAAAVRGARALNYRNAGTFEFIVDAQGYYFLEVNTRLQVEHPVTEEVTGLDLVEWQLRIASGEKLPLTQDEISYQGHAFESRIYAEDPGAGFQPSSGRITGLAWPMDARVEAGIEDGGYVSPFYDPMIAKIITTGADRPTALAQMTEALTNTRILGVATNLGFLRQLCAATKVAEALANTGFIDANTDSLITPPPLVLLIAAAAAAEIMAQKPKVQGQTSPWSSDAWAGLCDRHQLDPRAPFGRLALAHGDQHAIACVQLIRDSTLWLNIALDGQSHSITATANCCDGMIQGHCGPHDWVAIPDILGVDLIFEGTRHRLSATNTAAQDELDPAARSPLPGVVSALPLRVGDIVAKGDTVAVVEAMKMENALLAPMSGTIDEVNCEMGQQVTAGQILVVITPQTSEA